MDIQGVPKIALQKYFKCYCVASVTKTFSFKGVQNKVFVTLAIQ
jgi:hypothetical protein